jgi:hypothetical protein
MGSSDHCESRGNIEKQSTQKRLDSDHESSLATHRAIKTLRHSSSYVLYDMKVD